MRLYERFCGLVLGGRRQTPSKAPRSPQGRPQARSGPAQTTTLVITRDADSFYHGLTDEDFIAWIRSWSPQPTVLRVEDREHLIDRMRAENP